MAPSVRPRLLAPPAGMRDLVHPESEARRSLARALLDRFARYGYDLVTTPPFEHADVLERGLDAVDPRDLLRFVEPDTGEVALLRPDITPQIARIVATGLSERPAPYRIAYEGTVVRRRRGRARRHRQIAQCGVECIGVQGPDGDCEVVLLAVEACAAVGLTDVRVELGHAGIGRALLDEVPEPHREDATDALALKDTARLRRVLDEAGVHAGAMDRLLALGTLFGGVEVVSRAHGLLGDVRALGELDRFVDALARGGLDPARLGVDLGEVRGMAYYTGASFALLAEGPGEPVGGGGRYDGLLARFGAPNPATGFALDLDNLEWALRHAGRAFRAERALRVVAIGPGRDRAAQRLRAEGVTVCVLPAVDDAGALAFAQAWGYDGALAAEADGWRVTSVSGAVQNMAANAPLDLVRRALERAER